MSETPDGGERERPEGKRIGWGPKLFFSTLLALLVFFYWLLIYSGGVSVHHG